MIKKEGKPHLSRRQFVSAAAVTAAVAVVPRHVLGQGQTPPSEKVNVAVIGVGGQGRTNSQALLHEDDAQIVAIADPAEKWDLEPFYYKGTAGRGPVKAMIEKHYAEEKKLENYKCAEYVDFREMLDKEKAIDAVLIATPDHNHAYIGITAMKQGKHVYCEKPLTHNVWEARQMAKVAKETKVATQMGNQGRSTEGHRQTAEWIWDGAIGHVREVHAWSDAGRFAKFGKPPETPTPEGLNWDLWLGTRAERPFSSAVAPFNWRGYWDFGGGALADMAIHNMDPAVNALHLEHPTSIQATGPGVDEHAATTGVLCTYHFDRRGAMPPVKMMWYDGGLRPSFPMDLNPDDPKNRLGEGGNGVLFVGDKGYITAAGWSGMPRLLPLSLHTSYQRPEKTIPRVKGHHADWLQACKGGKQASSNFEYAARLTEIVLLGNVALRSKKVLLWDGPNMKATNHPDAEKFLKEEYRKGWEIPV